MATTAYIYICLCLLFNIIASTVTKFELIIDGSNRGDGSDFRVSLYWDDNRYSCTFNPLNAADGTTLTCDNPPATSIPSGPYTRFYAKLEYDGTTAIQLRSLNVIDNNGNYYTINNFCISSGMECTFINHGFTPSITRCDQFDHQNSYPALALGGATKFTLLYIDFRNGATDYPNRFFEGSIRPPIITEIGLEIDDGSSTPAIEHTMSAQWDNTLYTCTMIPNEKIYCTPQTDPVICPGGLPSSFWISVYNPATDFGAALPLDAVYIKDETNTTYYMRDICLEPGVLATQVYASAQDCVSLPGYKAVHSHTSSDYLAVGGFTSWWTVMGYYTNAAAMIAPQCLFNYPNDKSPPLEIETINAGNIAPNGLYGWGPGLYGNDVIDCPPTSSPTPAPSISPTSAPSSAPTIAPTLTPTSSPSLAPTFSPTTNPTSTPTSPPTNAPTNVPTIAPTLVPTISPTISPTIAPSLNPSIAPTQPPSLSPSFSPTTPPTNTPSLSPSIAPSLAPTQPPSNAPSIAPTDAPSLSPSSSPSIAPSITPTLAPSIAPTQPPSSAPSLAPTIAPSLAPTQPPTNIPSIAPSIAPSLAPSISPTNAPTESTNNPTSSTYNPTSAPTTTPSISPTNAPSISPTNFPTFSPSFSPSFSPVTAPTPSPSNSPSFSPTLPPTPNCPTVYVTVMNDPFNNVFNGLFTFVHNKMSFNRPWWESPQNPNDQNIHYTGSSWIINGENHGFLSYTSPSYYPPESDINAQWTHSSINGIFNVLIKCINSASPTHAPTNAPTNAPTSVPSNTPTPAPTINPTIAPSNAPSKYPTNNPTNNPTNVPSNFPTKIPTFSPTSNPTLSPTDIPSNDPTNEPTMEPTNIPTFMPTNNPTIEPTLEPTIVPTIYPTNIPTNNPTIIPTANPTNNPITSTELTQIMDAVIISGDSGPKVSDILFGLFIALFVIIIVGIIVVMYMNHMKTKQAKINDMMNNMSGVVAMETPTNTSVKASPISPVSTTTLIFDNEGDGNTIKGHLGIDTLIDKFINVQQVNENENENENKSENENENENENEELEKGNEENINEMDEKNDEIKNDTLIPESTQLKNLSTASAVHKLEKIWNDVEANENAELEIDFDDVNANDGNSTVL